VDPFAEHRLNHATFLEREKPSASGQHPSEKSSTCNSDCPNKCRTITNNRLVNSGLGKKRHCNFPYRPHQTEADAGRNPHPLCFEKNDQVRPVRLTNRPNAATYRSRISHSASLKYVRSGVRSPYVCRLKAAAVGAILERQARPLPLTLDRRVAQR